MIIACFLNNLIPDTTNRQATRLIITIAEGFLSIGSQIAAVSIEAIFLSTTPPVAVVTNVVERAVVVVTVTARKS